jgi:hypothetical protein
MPTITFRYTFTASNGIVREFDLRLDEKTLELQPRKRASYPEWTRLSHNQCPNCTLDEKTHPRCPIAANMVEVIEHFGDAVSHEEVEVEIASPERIYKRKASLQEGIGSLIGIYMVTSGCPVMDKLRPMVRTHLPFATAEETLYRVISMYLLAQYFRLKKGKAPDWDLKELVRIYEEVRIVNQHFAKRLVSAQVKDASVNAVVVLDCFAETATFSINEAMLGDIERLFGAYL